ncbi:MAG: TIM barrel protein [Acidimicrobiia bacterium]|nr:TIM barrel protein [Acidimicrobiia bacterium]
MNTSGQSASHEVKLSANLGFLWTELELPAAIRAASAAGFAGVECHFPYDADPGRVRDALDETGLPMIGLNTRTGEADIGLAALPGRTNEARAAIDQAITYAAAVGCANVHVMAGRASGTEARAAYVDNLTYAALTGGAAGVGILIEPINQRDMPGYFLSEVETAAEIIHEVDGNAAPGTERNVAIMFDCYHVQITQGDLLRRFEAHMPLVGHVQFAAVPSRNEPNESEVDFGWLLPQLYAAGYDGFVGAEYRPTTTTDAGLGWMEAFG